jgi:predicted methyltransferase
MKKLVVVLGAGALLAGWIFMSQETATSHYTVYEQAVNDPGRSDEDRARDESRKPGQILEFYGVEPGMTVVDMVSGGGYYTVMLSNVVGPDGLIYAHNTTGTPEEDMTARAERYEPLGNVTLTQSDMWSLDIADDSVDRVFLFLIWHHVHFQPDDGERMSDYAKAVVAEARRVLKPGGVFGIIEHRAATGSSRADSNDWHRVPEELVIEDLTSQGFELAATSDLLAVDGDPMNCDWHECRERGETVRWVHAYKSPD